MKKLFVSLNDQEYKHFLEKAEASELSEYALIKKLILDCLYGETQNNSDNATLSHIKQIKTLKKQQQWAFFAIFLLVCYFVLSLTYILLF
jgi:hypothetical protein